MVERGHFARPSSNMKMPQIEKMRRPDNTSRALYSRVHLLIFSAFFISFLFFLFFLSFIPFFIYEGIHLTLALARNCGESLS